MKRETMRRVRKDRLNLSQHALGEIIGRSQRQISQIENGIAPMPLWMPLALAWLLHFGASQPFPDE